MSCIEISPEINLREVFVSFIKSVAHDCDKVLREKRIPYTDASIYTENDNNETHLQKREQQSVQSRDASIV